MLYLLSAAGADSAKEGRRLVLSVLPALLLLLLLLLLLMLMLWLLMLMLMFEHHLPGRALGTLLERVASPRSMAVVASTLRNLCSQTKAFQCSSGICFP